jgi:hypothetical protein
MSALEACRAELDRASAGLDSVTARRAIHTATQALGEFESSLALLGWERDRVARVAEQRAERERQARAEAEARDAACKAAERTRAARRLERIERDRSLVKGKV